MAVLNKTQLLQNRIDNIYPNLSNEVSAAMVGTFCDNFIDSIYDYTDNKWSLLATFDDTKIGVFGENYIDFDANEMSVNVNSDELVINMLNATSKTIKTSATKLDFISNVDIYGSNNRLRIGTDNATSNPHIDFDADDITIRSDFDNGQLAIWDTFSSTYKMVIANNVLLYTNLIVDNTKSIRAKYKSSDNTDGLTSTYTIYTGLVDAIYTYKDGLITNINESGSDVQVDVFADGGPDDGNPLENVDVEINDGVKTLITNSIGRITFKAKIGIQHKLYLRSPGAYDEITHLFTPSSSSTFINLTMPYTG